MSQLNPPTKRPQETAVVGSEHYHAVMKKEHPDWNFCPTCNASLRESPKTGVFALFLTHPDNKFVISISLSPDEGTGVISPFSMDGSVSTKFPVWAEPAQVGSQGLAKERLFEETIIQHLLPAFRYGFKIARSNASEEHMQVFAQIFMRYAQKDLAEQTLRQVSSIPKVPQTQDLTVKSGSVPSAIFDPRQKLSELEVVTSSALSQNGFRLPNMTSTGVLGFDRITNGGIPSKRITLLSGPSGLGKTIFGIQFLGEGMKRMEQGILALADHNPLDVVSEAETLGIPLVKWLNEKKLFLIVLDPKRTYSSKGLRIINTKTQSEFLETIDVVTSKTGAKRIVVDCFTTLFANSDPLSARRKIKEVTESLEKLRATVLVTGFVPSGSKSLTFLGFEENYVSGVIALSSRSVAGSIVRYLYVPKMKGTDHNLQKFVYDIEPRQGLIVLDPLRDYIAKIQDSTSQTVRDALQIANVLRSLTLSNFSPQISNLAQNQAISTIPPAVTKSEVSEASQQLDSDPSESAPALKSSVQTKGRQGSSKPPPKLQANFTSNNPQKVVITEAKLPTSASDNPWASILQSRDDDEEEEGSNGKDAGK